MRARAHGLGVLATARVEAPNVMESRPDADRRNMRVNPPGNAGGYGQGPQAERTERAERDGKRRQQQQQQQDQQSRPEEHDQVELRGPEVKVGAELPVKPAPPVTPIAGTAANRPSPDRPSPDRPSPDRPPLDLSA